MLNDLNDFDISDIDFENIGSWPLIIRIAACVIVFVVLIAVAYYFNTQKQMKVLSEYQTKEKELRAVFESKQQRTVNLQKFKDQLVTMRKTFGAMLHQLPSRNEVPGLLEDISKNGRTSGLEFKLFAPQREVHHDFYAELPIRIEVIGTYKQFARFVSHIASLDRIVTLHDLQITKTVKPNIGKTAKFLQHLKNKKNKDKKKKQKDELLLSIVAKTYRYSDAMAKKDGENAIR